MGDDDLDQRALEAQADYYEEQQRRQDLSGASVSSALPSPEGPSGVVTPAPEAPGALAPAVMPWGNRAIPQPEPVTAAQAKVEAIASLTHSAYARASELKLTPEEIQALQAEFPDEAFKPGAAGKEHLIYIEHAFLRDRLNQVIGIGQWAMIPRNRWAEDFTTSNNKPASRIYVEAMMVVRGCFVAENIGDMDYYHNNPGTNYGDAVRGALTQAMRRCCADLGIGLQAWKKDFGDGWWQRNGAKYGKTFYKAPGVAPTPPTGKSAGMHAVAVPVATEAHRKRFLEILEDQASLAPDLMSVAHEFFQKVNALLPNETLAEIPLQFMPVSKEQLDALIKSIDAFGAGEEARMPYPQNPVSAVRAAPPAKGPDVGDVWREFPMPFGKNAGTPLGKLEKNYLFGLWANFAVETEYKGKPRAQDKIDSDKRFRLMLDLAGKHYEFTKKD